MKANMKDYLFYGAITEPIAPMDKNEEIDYGLFELQVAYQLQFGIRGIFVSGLTECMVTSLDEQVDMLESAVKTVNGKIPVMASMCVNRFSEALNTLRRFEDKGATAVSIVQPHTFTYTEDEIYRFYTDLIHATKLPVYIYNAPQTNNTLSPAFVQRLIRENENIRGYKDSLLDIMHLQELMSGIEKGRHLEVIAGSDASTFATMSMGGCGIISWVSIMFPQLVIDLCDAFLNGDLVGARELQFKVQKLRKVLKIGPMDSGYRYAGDLLGLPMGIARRPMSFATDEQKARIKENLIRLGYMK